MQPITGIEHPPSAPSIQPGEHAGAARSPLTHAAEPWPALQTLPQLPQLSASSLTLNSRSATSEPVVPVDAPHATSAPFDSSLAARERLPRRVPAAKIISASGPCTAVVF